ncbi:MAG: hypothetical protein IKE30_04605 [Clostridia bacterium]|nr:hypothetical protein [Clostridia bacterium]
MDPDFEKRIIRCLFLRKYRDRAEFLIDRGDRDKLFYRIEEKIDPRFLRPVKAKAAGCSAMYRSMKDEGCGEQCYFMSDNSEKSGFCSLKQASDLILWAWPALLVDTDLKTGFLESDGEIKWMHFLIRRPV